MQNASELSGLPLGTNFVPCTVCGSQTVVLYGEQQFNRVRGYAEIAQVLATIEAEPQSAPTKKAA